MYYLIYDKKTGYIAYITEFEDQVYYDENTQNVFTTEALPDWFNDITKRPIIKNGEIIEDPTFIYLTPEQLQLQQAKNAKLEEMIQEEMQRIIRQQAIDNLVKVGKIVADELQKIVELENGDEDTKLLEQ